MKITLVAAITAFFVAAAPFALAQEESTPPAASPEATAPEKADDPSVSVTTEKTSPAPKSETSPSPTKSSSPVASKSSPRATPSTSSSSSTAVMPAKKSTPEATLREIEDKWEASVTHHDPSVAQAYLGDDFRGVSSKGKVMTKSDLLSEIKKDTDVYNSTKNGKVDVRVFGGQFAVTTGTSTEVGKAKDGQAFKRSFRWTDVWVLRKDRWQCVASQAMLVK
ncbi:MAG TPA: nuclear transport factor 2 family protein [Chthoniobacterales bacterium]|nr:nuclear transport factor 2 family protein [Chthoniobacterales bacterium]